jgi:imidazolonepropionase-like amidohydrolase
MTPTYSSFDCRCPHRPLSSRVIELAEAALERRAFLVGALATVGAVFFPRLGRAAEATVPESVTVLRAARLFDGTALHAPGVLVLRGDRIVSMNAGDAGSDARTIELGDATLMPGLIDAHTHVAAGVVTSRYLEALGRPNSLADSIAEATLLSIKNATSMLANGFTTIRDVGGGEGIDLAMRNAIARGAIVGPRILAAGTALSITGGHGDSNDLPDFVHVDGDYEPGTAFGPYGFREQVRQHVKRHVDLIKITATGGVLSYGDTFDVPQLNLDEIQAVVDDKGIALAVEGGCHSIEHCTGVETKTLADMQQRGTYLVPTIWALDSILQPGNPNKIPPDSLEKAHQAAQLRNAGMERALGTGVKIAYGTDAGVFPHGENNRDFALLKSMGMHSLDLLKSTTSVAADLLGTNDRGRLAPGKLADVVAFAGDPSADPGLLGVAPKLVILGGKRIA